MFIFSDNKLYIMVIHLLCSMVYDGRITNALLKTKHVITNITKIACFFQVIDCTVHFVPELLMLIQEGQI